MASPPSGWQPRANPWIIAASVMLATFMEVLDTSVANVSLVVQRVPVKILFDQPPPREYPIGPGMSVVPVVKVT